MTKVRNASLALLTVLVTPIAANATLIGDTVSGSLGTATSGAATVTTPFAPSAVVGGGVEFSGVITDAFSQIWTIDVDIAASSFSVAISESTRGGNGNVLAQDDLLVVALSDLDWLPAASIADVVLSSYVCSAGAAFPCTTFGGGPSISLLDFGADYINFQANTMRDGETYIFDIVTVAVPEPTSITLLGLGLIGLGFARRRKV